MTPSLSASTSPVSRTLRTIFTPLRHLPSASHRSLSRLSAMAWRSSGSSNSELIENLYRHKLITDSRVKEAFLKVDRAHYAPAMAYEDSPQPIGHSATISAPHMHASALENVLRYLTPDDGSPRRVLDVGSGSGYLTAVFAEFITGGGDGREGNLVVGLEHIPALRDLGEENMRKSARGRELLDKGVVQFRVGDGRKGWVEEGRSEWDVIHVGAAAKTVHEELLEQLRAPGCMFIPVDDDTTGMDQSVWRIEKDEDGRVTRKRLFGVRYVPLTDAPRR